MLYFNFMRRNYPGRLIFSLIFSLLLGHFSLLFAEHIPGQIIVRFKPAMIKISKGLAISSVRAASVSAASLRALNVKYQIASFAQIYNSALKIHPGLKHLQEDYLLTFPPEKNMAEVVNAFRKDPNVIFAYPNTVVRAFETLPNDPQYSEQWGLAKIKASQAWDKSTGSPDIRVAVLDTGINYLHEDLKGAVDLTYAKNYIASNNNPLDDNGHGSATSAVIAAVTSNEVGMAGLVWQGKIIPLKVLDSKGSGDMATILTALGDIIARKKEGVNIVAANMSLGEYNSGSDKYSEEDFGGLKERCLEAYNNGIVLVAAAGNGGVDWNTYPAYYSTVLSVSATDQSDKRSIWSGTDLVTGNTQSSNYGSWIRVSAPGTAILSVKYEGGYTSGWNGTSLAAPFVAGLAALLKAANPSAKIADIFTQIKENADNIDALNPGYEGKLGSGRINAYKSIMGLTAKITSPVSDGTKKYLKGKIEIIGTAEGWNFSSYKLEASKESSVITIESSSTQVRGGILGTWETSGINGDYILRLRVFASDLSSIETTVPVTVDNTSPEAAIVSPLNGAKVEGKVTIIGTAEDSNFDYYSLEYGKGTSPSAFELIGLFYVPVANGIIGTWETTGLSGPYTLRVRGFDKAGNYSTASISVEAKETAISAKNVQLQNSLPLTFVLPNPFDRSATSETSFVYNLSGNFTTTVYLFDLSGNLIWRKNYSPGENGGKAGQNTPGWNGVDLFGEGVVNGVYLYQVTADNTVIARGKIVVLN